MNTTANTDTIARLNRLASGWIASNETANTRLIERFSNPSAIANSGVIEDLVTNAARTRVAYQVQSILTYHGELTDAATHVITAAIRGAQVNQQTTSAGDRALGLATTEAWLEVAAVANGDRY